MSTLPKEFLREMITSGNLKSAGDLQSDLKDIFKDVLQEMLEAELEVELAILRETGKTRILLIAGMVILKRR